MYLLIDNKQEILFVSRNKIKSNIHNIIEFNEEWEYEGNEIFIFSLGYYFKDEIFKDELIEIDSDNFIDTIIRNYLGRFTLEITRNCYNHKIINIYENEIIINSVIISDPLDHLHEIKY